jgi:hypothetical protein
VQQLTRPRPDDPRANDPALYVIFGLASLLLIALAIGAMVMPPLFVYSLLTHHHPVGAVALASGWIGYLVWVGQKLMRARPPEDE